MQNTPTPITGRVVSVQASPEGGLPKPRLAEIHINTAGVDGDAHRDTQHHGGPDQAVCLFDMETYRQLESEGMAVFPGAFSENVTTEGLDFQALGPGWRLSLGESVVLEITKVRVPCFKLTPIDARLPDGLVDRSGWMTRVLAEGTVRPGDPIRATAPEPVSGG